MLTDFNIPSPPKNNNNQFNDPLSRSTWVSWYQRNIHSLILRLCTCPCSPLRVRRCPLKSVTVASILISNVKGVGHGPSRKTWLASGNAA